MVFIEERNIVGSLPDNWQNLKKLDTIQIVSSSISGTIPAWIDQWSVATFLSFTDNLLNGTLPTSFSSLTNLIVLAVDNNFLTGDLSLIEGLTKVTGMYLDSNGFTGTIDDNFLKNLSSLRILDVSGNGFEGAVPVHLMGLPTLQVMDIHGNQLTDFSDLIPANGSLSFLTIYDNPIAGQFPITTMKNLGELDHLDLTSTEFTGGMPSEIGELTKLTYLFMAGTNFTSGSIPKEFQKLTNLVDLSLKDSGRTGVS